MLFEMLLAMLFAKLTWWAGQNTKFNQWGLCILLYYHLCYLCNNIYIVISVQFNLKYYLFIYLFISFFINNTNKKTYLLGVHWSPVDFCWTLESIGVCWSPVDFCWTLESIGVCWSPVDFHWSLLESSGLPVDFGVHWSLMDFYWTLESIGV